MLLLEHDAKQILTDQGLAVPRGVLIEPGVEPGSAAPPGPWMVKAQVPAGGRGRAGGVRQADTWAVAAGIARSLLGMELLGRTVRAVRVEETVQGARETYLAFSVDPVSAGLRVLASPVGGMDVEETGRDHLIAEEAGPDPEEIDAALARLAPALPEDLRAGLTAAGRALGRLALARELLLLEINPLFIFPNGGWVAGDVRMVADENALPRQDGLRALVTGRAAAYPNTAFKLAHGFDFVVVDPEGEIGLLTTGAGLSMKLIDEIAARGARAYNFCDIRSGQMRGDPARLTAGLRLMAEAPRLSCVLVNIFAGITELGEFAELLIAASAAVPELRVPVVVRLAGNGEDRADALLRTSGLPLRIERDLDRAVGLAVDFCRDGRAHA